MNDTVRHTIPRRLDDPERWLFWTVDEAAALMGSALLGLAANLTLILGFSVREAVTVLLPAVSGPVWEVGGGRAGARYLEDMARTAAVTLLRLTPDNAGHVREAAARLAHASARGAIDAWVEAEAGRMAGRDLATAFYPTDIGADTERLSVLWKSGAHPNLGISCSG